MGYHWPGNIRQLENVIQRAFAMGVKEVLDVDDLPPEIAQKTTTDFSAESTFNLQAIEKK